ncbi:MULTISPECIES: HD-GYP domain-containing protein [unclassified Sedimentibacter]|uniref:HD-GYP domain-containing protein n=1 Tax=unclassified Sedimentibacter TaxID=2649220 RepID=UPI0027DFCB3F|nr:HD-GYP domain-containing protein [Sedimentibacter sp. MB35-C1]WMJ75766.1 HD-GYP domain-containing protein [Sedimentibacter sp. MB35-C1]
MKNIADNKIPKKEKISTNLFLYIFILAITAFVLMLHLSRVYAINDYSLLIVFSALSIIAETFFILLPKVGAISVSFALYYSAIILTNPLLASIISAIGVAFRFPYKDGVGRVHILNNPIYKTIFNTSQLMICSGMAGMAYVYLNNIINVGFDFYNPVAGAAALSVYILLNTLFMSALMSILLNEKFIYIWRNNFFSMMINVLLVGLLGIILAFAYNSYGIGGLLLFFIPLLLARYTFKLYIDMRKNYFETMNVLVRAIEANDPYTSGHSLRVSAYSEAVAKQIGLPQSKIDLIKSAALLHDIGKIGIDKNILNKTGKLERDEFETIKSHPEIGATIIADLSYLSNISDIIRHHHERNDGKGYPDGLCHDSIPLETSILTIADSFDAMTTNRPYRKSLSLEAALSEIKLNSGTQFNPDIVDDAIIALRTTYYKVTE